MEPIAHLFLPVLLILAIYPNIPKRYVFYLAPLTFLMDFDLFFPDFHRILFHNLFFVIFVAALVYLLWNKRAFFISLFYLSSHLILDLAYPGSAWFYPVVEKTFYIDASILFSGKPIINFWIGSLSLNEFLEITTFGYSNWFSVIGLILILLVFILVIFKKKN
jgi:LPXTG-motif cell wall-anchored protein